MITGAEGARGTGAVPSQTGRATMRAANFRRWLHGYNPIGANPVQGRPRRGLTWPLRLLVAASLAVPVLLFGLAAWQNFRLVQVQAEQRVTIDAGQLHEHALNAFETYALVLAWIDDRLRGLDWDRIETDQGLHRLLSDIETLPQVGSLSIVDATGQVRAAGTMPPPSLADFSHRDSFVAQKEHDAGIFIGHDQYDERSGAIDFDVSRRRSTSDGRFDGVIVLTARPGYFRDFFGTVSQHKHFSGLLMRGDGLVLVRYPQLPGQLIFAASRPIMQAIAAQPARGSFHGEGATDGIERLFAYQRVGGFPLYVVFGIPTRGVLASWRANLVDYLVFAVPAALALFCMTFFAARQLQQQKITTWRWRTTAQRLKREMTRRTRAEAELHQAQKMEALGQLTGSVAHDFNNLLTVLQGCLEMISGRQRDDRLQARVNMALGTIERGEKLTGNLLAFARRQPLTAQRFDANDLLRGISELLGQTVGGAIAVTSNLAPDLWPLDADASQLELAVINLAINARDAMPDGGTLQLRTFNITVAPREAPRLTLTNSGDFVAIEVSDTGTGMTPEVVARAFEPFFSSKGAGKGTGLGLSIVYGFARQSGGSATIRSEVGRGTTVTILLPRSLEPGASEGRGSTGLPPGGTA